MFGYKRLLLEKDQRIADLKSQISDLRALVIPKNTQSNIPLHLLEADAILSQKDEVLEVSEEVTRMREEEISERDRILAGNY